ncbi:olfactory receptor 6C4-like [Epinephelus fuscoguttatus]|uniref:olfactory receptor 6C4-like n=1 Tax=Epinephelus fuscoguttatus TaxID=293821 RepID=UPI0020D05118|nr:olfactory receptor 6C4-like [Epinephelus fuscoguttatus]
MLRARRERTFIYISHCTVDWKSLSFTMNLFNSAFGKNISFVRPAYFVISGFSGIPNIKYYYVFLFFVYVVSVLGNAVVMTVIYLDHNLRTPKYSVVFNLAFADLFSNTALVPKVLDIFLFNHHYIPYNDCLTFLFFCYTGLSMQAFNLIALSYDRLIAIIYPLHYQVKVTNRFMLSLIASFWIFVIIAVLIAAGLLTRLSFCKSVVINSYFCDHGQIYRLACNDYTPSFVISILLPVLIIWFPLIFILFTYIYIAYVLSKVATVQERLKAFKTCAAHISLVAVYFLPVLITFTLMEKIHPNARIINLSLTSVFPPMLNPIIYVLQTQEIKESVKRLLKIRFQSKIVFPKVTTV